MEKILIVEDNQGLREQLKWALTDTYEILEADSLESASIGFAKYKPFAVLLDMGLENSSERGLEIIDAIIHMQRDVKIIVMTSNTDESLGPRCIEQGAFDFLNKPVDIDELKVILTRAQRMGKLEKPIEEEQVASHIGESDFIMVGESSAMKNIFGHITKLAKTDVNVLITGESGTGKELCARAVHYHSNRSSEPFVPINCGAIPESLMESELFGYMKGAFTGANSDKMGLIESAHGGTLFLDEIGDMPKNLQVKLLRFLEDHNLQRLGGTQLRKLDVRVIAATNRENLSEKENDSLRTDLFYRLSEFEIHLPPLRERGEDIIKIADNLLVKYRDKFSMPKLKISPRAKKLLMNYSWPGNVRELENKLSKAAITCENQCIEEEDLQLSESSFKTLTLKEARQMFEKNFLLNALKQAKGVVSVAAKNSGVTRPTFYDLMKKNGIQVQMKAVMDGDNIA